MSIEGNLEQMGNKTTQNKNNRNYSKHHAEVTFFNVLVCIEYFICINKHSSMK